MHSISEVIILNNDQHQHKKQLQQTTGLIQRLDKEIFLFYCLREVLFQKVCLFACTSLSCMENNFLPADKGNRVKHSQS